MTEMKNQTVIVAGASGAFGRHIRRALTEAGHTVLGLGRGEGNEIRGDLLDREGLLRAFAGVQADTVVHAATALKKPPMSHKGMFGTDDLRTTGTANLIEAAKLAGVRRFVGENIAFGYGYRDFGDRVLTEADPFGVPESDANINRHLEGMRAKEQLALESGLEAISLRFGLFYGPGGTETMVEMLRKRQMPAFNDDGRVLPWVHLADAADAVVAAVEKGRPGEAYNIVDDEIGFGGITREIAAAFHTPKPFTVPVWAMVVMPYLHVMLKTNLRVSTEKARRELGWTPTYPTVADGLRAEAASLAA
ncbi:MAG: NAD-dependent epimerase/dehydratase family protein [Hamadaea sp.]|uniref:NAD-dependent epimerase/dehydratase family protein n=1 Tax=Hamadaea sp. TaxID=2024425 RepID=UPI0018184269|nr:NAD-dependent epimerase/dehydratase family protein [Hamadaea sp.]NUR72577.1 NAD-dependent epimerase/dehydratase family protein [Hamadaea sp.]NUT22214.1 NAD-dependent epimerase/dehydratase family protein [Hamadaea sp.]